MNGEKMNPFRLLVRKAEGKRPLETLKHRWVNNIKMNLEEMGWCCVEWTGLVWLRIWTDGEIL
jgi:hypothetical protein